MVTLTTPPPTLAAGNLTLFYVVDDLLARSPILIFYGPSATATSNSNSSRIQAHVFSPAGLQSSPRLTVSPSSPLYSAITCLPREEQSDEVVRGLAFSLYKYFTELPEGVRNTWIQQPTPLGKQPHAPQLLSDAHAAILASRMQRVENAADVIRDLQNALAEQKLSWLDVDLVLPPGSIKPVDARNSLDQGDDDYARRRFGGYASIVKLFGEPTFLPTSKLRRAPSKPSGLNRQTTFSRHQKENLRREINELLDTEENYVGKLDDLLHSVAEEFREKARNKSTDSQSPSSQALEKLFPPSLDEILNVNGQFLEAMRTAVEETENSAIKDIEATSEDVAAPAKQPTDTDMTGAVRVAECLLDWIPKFSDCYADYMQAHTQFPQYLRTFSNDSASSFSKRIVETGEQRLMSMLIEPVQRLPRYSLYVDNIVKQLPARHPATKIFLKARDTVSEICSRDAAPMSPSSITELLGRLAPLWPSSLKPTGRLVTAVDATLVDPPYHASSSKATHSIILLFTDYVVILGKKTKQATSARTLLSYLDNTAIVPDLDSEPDLEYRHFMPLCDVDISEFSDGKKIQMLQTPSNATQGTADQRRPGSKSLQKSVQVFQLAGLYDAKATRLTEEFAKARIEGRFSEIEREGSSWEVRSTGSSGDLQLITAVCEDPARSTVEGRGNPAKIRIVVDPLRGTRELKPSEDGVDILVNLAIQGESFFKMEVSSALASSSKDHVTNQEFLAVFGKRLNNFLQFNSAIRNPQITPVLLTRNQLLLQSLNIRLESGATDDNTSIKDVNRTPSPVKMLSSFFGGSSSPTKHIRGALSVDHAPRLPPNTPSLTSTTDALEAQSSQAPARPKSYLERKPSLAKDSGDSSLEQTLNTYIIALHARKGNVVGRVLQARANSAEEAAVNELYNTLLEDPSAWQTAAQAPVDVLFAAFEKFVRGVWNDQIGDILSNTSLTSFHSTGHFILESSSPGSQHALREIVKLLADLLDGTRSDADRGILTAAFSEVLVPEGSSGPHEVIPLLDRLVADFHGIFLASEAPSGQGTPSAGSVHSRSESTGVTSNLGSFSSHHSSLRKKFGFATLHRKNSKLESERDPENTSLWRTLSKGRSGASSNAVDGLMPAPLLTRSKSQDERDHLFGTPKRPVSRDRPSVMDAFANPPGLVTIGESIGEGLASGPPRKKRRSSLSDLMELQNSPTPNRLDLQLPQSPRLGSPTRPTGIPQPRNAAGTSSGSPKKENATPYYNSTLPRLTSPLSPSSSASTITRGSPNRPSGPRVNVNSIFTNPPSSKSPAKDEVTVTAHATSPTKRRTGSVTATGSGIPSLKPTAGALSDRPGAANIARYPPSSPQKQTEQPAKVTPASPVRKMRMQGPQKLRERMATETQAIKDADAALSAEMAKIGEELDALGARPSSASSRPGTASSAGSIQNSQLSSQSTLSDNAKFKTLETRLKGLEMAIPTTISSLSKRLTALEADVSSSLSVSEQKARGLDELLREASAENEALYGRFNEELAKIMRGVRDSPREQAVSEMRKQMASMKEEQERLRKENARLRREAVGLRAQLRE